MPRRDERLNQQSINRFRRRIREIQAGQIDLPIPRLEKAEIGFETRAKLRRQIDAGAFRAAAQTILELAARHEAAEIRPRNTPSTATAAGVTPGILDA